MLSFTSYSNTPSERWWLIQIFGAEWSVAGLWLPSKHPLYCSINLQLVLWNSSSIAKAESTLLPNTLWECHLSRYHYAASIQWVMLTVLCHCKTDISFGPLSPALLLMQAYISTSSKKKGLRWVYLVSTFLKVNWCKKTPGSLQDLITKSRMMLTFMNSNRISISKRFDIPWDWKIHSSRKNAHWMKPAGKKKKKRVLQTFQSCHCVRAI